jgi:hypothetical protein
LAAFLATSLSAGAAVLSPGAAHAQVSPADPNYSYDTRGHTTPWHGGYAAASQAYAQGALNARASAVAAERGQDPDPNVRLQLLRSQGLSDR